jgi:hypothetical protein
MLTGDCSGCHTTANWNSSTLPAGHMPNPANQACTVCHTSAPSNYATLAANAVLHTGIASGCITCHGAPNAAAPVFYLNYTPKDAILSPVHIPTSTTACENCHAVSFTSFSGTTMTAAKHTVMLTVTGGTCDQCHDLSTLSFYGVTNLTTRPSGHHVGQDCKGCHSPNNWGGGAAKRKAATAPTPTRTTVGTVVGPPATRSDTGSETASSSGTAALGAVRGAGTPRERGGTQLSHFGIAANCVSCHNGVLAAGKGAGHIASNSACENCHTTLAWMPARFDHQSVTAKCASCHNGVIGPGRPTRHILTSEDCSACHGTFAWLPATFDHFGISATCLSCHNGITATGKQAQHAVTSLDCAACHTTFNWTVATPVRTPLRPLIPKPVSRGPTIERGK